MLLGAILTSAKMQLWAVVVIASLSATVWQGFKGDWNIGVLASVGVASSTVTVIMQAWNAFLWRRPLIQRLPFVSRDISGTWQGTLESHWIDPTTGTRVPAKTVFLVINQTASDVMVTLVTDQSESESVAAAFVKQGTSLQYTYSNEPTLAYRDGSPIHLGATFLSMHGERTITRLKGHYCTDRDTKGELDFANRHPASTRGFESAKALFDDFPK